MTTETLEQTDEKGRLMTYWGGREKRATEPAAEQRLDAENWRLKACRWTEDEHGNWDTDCENTFVIIDGNPIDNGMKFCCYCGKQLHEVKYIEETKND